VGSHLRRALASLAALLMACSASDKPAGPTDPGDSLSAGAIYVRAMMDIMQAHSINRRTIDWSSFRTQVLAAVPAGANVSGTFPAIRVALTLLGDNHSFYRATDGSVISGSSLSCSASTVTGVPTTGADVGYVRVTGFSGTAAQAQAFTDAIQSAIKAADSDQVRGWIVDLRGNGGGNMWPMIAGVGPILGTGTATSSIPMAGSCHGDTTVPGRR
jgi:carboxyl-terminal processing protease